MKSMQGRCEWLRTGVVSTIVLPIAVMSSAALAVDRTWVGSTGLPPGDGTTFNSALNWSPVGVPNALDAAIFNGVGGDILFGSAFTNNRQLIVRGLTPQVRLLLQGDAYFLNAPETSGPDRPFLVGPNPGDGVELEVLDGTLIAGAAAIAVAPGSDATLRVLDTATVILFGPVDIADEGVATLEVLQGSALLTTADVHAAREPGSEASITLDGTGTSWSVAGSLFLGGSDLGAGGLAALTVTNDAALSVGELLTLRPESEATISGATLDIGALHTTAATLAIDATSIASVNAGVPASGPGLSIGTTAPGEVTLRSGARVVAGDVILGAEALLDLDASRVECDALDIHPLARIRATFAPGSVTPGEQSLFRVTSMATLSGSLALELADPLDPPTLGASLDVVEANAVSGALLVTTTPLLGGLNFVDLSEVDDLGGTRVVAEVKTLDLRLSVDPPTTSPLPAPPNLLTVAPFGGDPLLLDAAVTIPGATRRDPGSLLILTNTLPFPGGTPGYIETTVIPVGAEPAGLGNGDLGGRGLRDIAVSSRGSGTVTIVRNLGGSVVGDPGFKVSQILDLGGAPGGLGIADITGNGALDIVVAESISGAFVVLFNDGTGFFAVGSVVPSGTGTKGVNPTDLDNDKDIDVVALNSGVPGDPSTASVSVHINTLVKGGPFTGFEPGVSYAVGPDPFALATGDLNGDGFPEIVTANAGDGTLSLLINRGDGTFEPAVSLDAGGTPTALALVDLDGDAASDLDIAVIVDNAGVPSLTVFRNDTTNGYLVLVPIFNAQSVFGIPAALASGDANGEGPPDLVLAGAGEAGGIAAGLLPGAISVQVSQPIACLGSLDGNGVVDGADLAILLGAWGPNPGSPADLNGDGFVNGADISILLANWGACN
ncbi:MAG: VCBS repeat-containing protein [Phycisphaeraceae bacterium]|nr:VCBS repeat-containing protein [Phycisphaeraceae bacterium]